jgi:hypothetical protein
VPVGIAARTNTAAIALPILLLALAEPACAQADCATHPPRPDSPAVVTGSPGERLYIQPQHPSLCKDVQSGTCKAKSYVLTGDAVRVAPECDNWVFMSFAGKKATTSGWVAPQRVTSMSNDTLSAIGAGASATRLPTACTEAEGKLNDWLNRGDRQAPALPSGLTNSIRVEKLPPGTGDDTGGMNVWNIVVSDAQVGGKPIKTVGYGSGGTCHGDTLELWDTNYKNRIKIPTSDLDDSTNSDVDPADSGDYASEELVRFGGETYLAHIARGARYVKLYQLKSNMTALPACDLARVPTSHEFTQFAADSALCEAVLNEHVEDARLENITPVEFDDEVSQRLLGDLIMNQGAPFAMVARGQADPYNEGRLRPVGMLAYSHSDGAGCGHDSRSEWPAVLDRKGLPTQVVEKDIAFEHASSKSRLFQFHGTTYFETRTEELENGPPSDGPPTHEVWKLSAVGATKMCSFNPARYRAQPVPSSPARN